MPMFITLSAVHSFPVAYAGRVVQHLEDRTREGRGVVVTYGALLSMQAPRIPGWRVSGLTEGRLVRFHGGEEHSRLCMCTAPLTRQASLTRKKRILAKWLHEKIAFEG